MSLNFLNNMLLSLLRNHRVLFENTFYLSILQVIQLILPFIAYPYIVTTVGTENLGIILFAKSITAYFIIIVNFGLATSAVRSVAINRNNHTRLCEVVSSVFIIRSFLFVGSLIIFMLLVSYVPLFYIYRYVFYMTFMECLADLLFPVWFYQGIEKMAVITIVKLLAIVFYYPLLFTFVKTESDFILLPAFQSGSLFLSALIGIILLIKVENIRFVLPEKRILKETFVESIPFFVSRISVVINEYTAKVFSGIFLGMHEVAIFDLAQKICNTSLVPFQMLNQVVYPHIAKSQSRIFARKGFFGVVILATCAAVGMFIFCPYVINLLGKDKLNGAVLITRILCIYLLSAGITYFVGTPVLVGFGYGKAFNYSVIASTAVLLIIYGVYYTFDLFSLINFALALVVAEILILLIRLYFCKRYNLIFNISGRK